MNLLTSKPLSDQGNSVFNAVKIWSNYITLNNVSWKSSFEKIEKKKYSMIFIQTKTTDLFNTM